MPRRLPRKPLLLAGTVALLLTGAVAADYWTARPVDLKPTYVGRSACVDCHEKEASAYTGSHHDLAMDVATEQTVLADFDDVTFEHHGVVSRMFREGDKFMVHTEGESGQMEDFVVKYVFGVTPLQQYMVEFDRPADLPNDEVSRVQVLRLSWDSEKGQWFHLDPPDVNEKLEPDDPLHWTGIAQRWQTMCAECHSTDLKTNFDVKTNQYHTTFSEIDVSCEACHGPGSLHVELANSKSLFWDRNHGFGLATLKGDDPRGQLESCAPCHSRRGVLDDTFDAGDSYHDHYHLELLGQDTYHDDGQIKDEVYVFGSFIQSKMYHEGIRCTDCHDPHSLQLKYNGNEACTNCHQHAAGKYDVPSHHHHEPGTAAAMCVSCHMPHTYYMAVDPRRDHSLRVPRPDLSVKLGTPNACSSCHVQDQLAELTVSDAVPQSVDLSRYENWLLTAQQGNQAIADAIAQTDKWCKDACEKWYGTERKKPKHFAESIAAFRAGQTGAVDDLLKLATSTDDKHPAIARATAFRELASVSSGDRRYRELVAAASAAVSSETESPLVRAAAMLPIRSADPADQRSILLPLLKSDLRLLRTEAARTLAIASVYRTLTGQERTRVDLALREVKRSIDAMADRGGAQMNWAMINEQTGNAVAAVNAYQQAIRLEPNMTGPRTNLAALLEQLAGQQPPATAAKYRQEAAKLRQQELPLLLRDADLAPENADIQYRCGLALYLAGRMDEAMSRLIRARELAPGVEDFRTAVQLLQEKLDSQQ